MTGGHLIEACWGGWGVVGSEVQAAGWEVGGIGHSGNVIECTNRGEVVGGVRLTKRHDAVPVEGEGRVESAGVWVDRSDLRKTERERAGGREREREGEDYNHMFPRRQ